MLITSYILFFSSFELSQEDLEDFTTITVMPINTTGTGKNNNDG